MDARRGEMPSPLIVFPTPRILTGVMNKPSTTDNTSTDEADSDGRLRRLRNLGVSPAGESFEVVLLADEDADVAEERFVLKKLTRARLREPEQFRQHFDALCRLDHERLCDYRELFIGEKATRITRDYVEALPLDEYLARPITDEESRQLAEMTEDSDVEHQPQQSSEDSKQPSERSGDGASLPHDHDDAHDAADSSPVGGADEPTDVVDTAEADTPPAEPDSHPGPDRSVDGDSAPTEPGDDDRPATLEIPSSLMEDSEAADRALDLIILRLRRIVPQIVDALEYLHRFRQVHGNLTPSNVLIGPDDRVVLTDYGLYPELSIPPSSRRRHASYHAPEVDRGEFMPQSDLYALGAILFEALADRPYGARKRRETPEGTNDNFSPVYLSEIVPHCPASWVDLTHGLLTPDPRERTTLSDVHNQLATTETRSVNIPASVVEDQDTLYGRRESLEKLMERTQRSSQQRTLTLSLVEGPTGVGKTALLDALARQSAQRGWVVLHGKCFHREPIAYQGFEEIVDRLATIADELPDKPRHRLSAGRRRASRLFPQLAPDDEPPPDIGRSAAVEGLRQVLAELSQQRPILICFDDIHWAHRDSTRLLADLAEVPEAIRLAVVATWRPGTADSRREQPFWSEISTAPVDIERVTIEGFSKQEARRYVLNHGANLTLSQKQKVLRRGGLNPLLIDELIHELDDATPLPPGIADEQQHGHIDTDDQSDNTDPSEPVDHYLRGFIQERLHELTRAQRLVLQLLAIASGPLDSQLLSRALDRELGTQTADLVSGREVAESLIEDRLARRARNIEPAAEHSPRYVIVHDLARDVVLEELGHDHHARLCGLIADAMAGEDADTDDLRFEYLLRAGRGEAASRAAVLAARTALDRFAYHRAALLWDWLDERDELQERDRSDFARALFGAGEYQRAVEQIEILLPDASTTIDLHLRIRRTEAMLADGQRQRAVDAMDDAMQNAGVPYRSRPLTDRLASAGRHVRTSIARWSDAAAVADQNRPDDETFSRARLFGFGVETAPFLLHESCGHLQRRFARIATDSGFGPLLAHDRLRMIGEPWLPFLLRDGPKFDRWVDQADQIAEQFDHAQIRALTLETRALIARHRADLTTAIEHLDQAQQLVERGEVDAPLLIARLFVLRIRTAVEQGQIRSARRLVDRALHHFRHHRWLLALVRLAACDLELVAGRLDTVAAHIDQIRQFIGDDRNCPLHLWMMQRRTRLCIARGQPEVSVAEWDLLVDRVYSRPLRRDPRSRLLLHLSLARALAALAERQRALGEPHLRESMRRLRRNVRWLSDLQPWMGYWEHGALLRLKTRHQLLRRDHERALDLARRATETAGDDPPPLTDAINRETLGRAKLRLEKSDGRDLIDQAHQQYEQLGVYLPLVLEGWSPPASHARLQPEDED